MFHSREHCQIRRMMFNIHRIAIYTALIYGVNVCSAIAVEMTKKERSDFADHVIELADTSHGIFSMLGFSDELLLMDIVQKSDYLVHVLEPDESKVRDIQKLADQKNLSIQRIIVEKSLFQPLPYADNMIDVVLSHNLSQEKTNNLNSKDILRVLRPGGKFILSVSESNSVTESQIINSLQNAGFNNVEVEQNSLGVWAVVTKPLQAGADNWSHWEYGPDNNPVSHDKVIKAPYMIQWLGLPYYIAMPAITTVAGGRTFIAMGHIAHHEREEPWLNTLLARNGYNGKELWSMKLPDGYLVHRSAFIATNDVFYMIDLSGSGCLLLDPETGRKKGLIEIPDAEGQWKWMAKVDDTLFVLVGKEKDSPQTTIVRSPVTKWSWEELSTGYYKEKFEWGIGETILAYDLKNSKVLWSYSEETSIDSRGMVIGDDNIFYYCPKSHAGCMDLNTGKTVWINNDSNVVEQIEENGEGLWSTPGFRTSCISLYTPDVLFFQEQTKNKIVALSTSDGKFLWSRKKSKSNPNMVYADGRLVVDIGENGNTKALDIYTGETLLDYGFQKSSCARLTGCPDSFFCRGTPDGDGLTIYDRKSGKIYYNGSYRPACNDGAIAANGLLYVGPWLCDCNLSLMGTVTLCSEDDFKIAQPGTNDQCLVKGEGDILDVETLDVTPGDWSTYRGNNSHTGSSDVDVYPDIYTNWIYAPERKYKPTVAVSAGDLVFLCGDDGKVRAFDLKTGDLKWVYQTAGPIMRPPAIWNGRAYVGSGDGNVYALEATTGRLLWKFNSAPVERRIMVYGSLCSSWPVNSGILIEDGILYFAAGIVDHDGTYIYALDALTGEIRWQNFTSGCLDDTVQKGISAQGMITIAGDRLWLAGGNIISPAEYDLKTGKYVGNKPGKSTPQANRGEEIGVLNNYLVLGGRLQYSAIENVVSPGNFNIIEISPGYGTRNSVNFNNGKIPPVWNSEYILAVNSRYSTPELYYTDNVKSVMERGTKLEPLWKAEHPENTDFIAMSLLSNTALGIYEEKPVNSSLWPSCTLCMWDLEDGSVIRYWGLPGRALPGGLSVQKDGYLFVVLNDGGLVCFRSFRKMVSELNLLHYLTGEDEKLKSIMFDRFTRFIKSGYQPIDRKVLNETLDQVTSEMIDDFNSLLKDSTGDDKEQLIERFHELIQIIHEPKNRTLILDRLSDLGIDVGYDSKKQGYITKWNVLGSIPDLDEDGEDDINLVRIGEPNVDISKSCSIEGNDYAWGEYVTHLDYGKVEFHMIYGVCPSSCAYAYSEINLPQDETLFLKIGSDDRFKCWFNGEDAGMFDKNHGWTPDQTVLKIKGRKGINTILVKLANCDGEWALSAKLTDEQNQPLDLTQFSSM